MFVCQCLGSKTALWPRGVLRSGPHVLVAAVKGAADCTRAWAVRQEWGLLEAVSGLAVHGQPTCLGVRGLPGPHPPSSLG